MLAGGGTFWKRSILMRRTPLIRGLAAALALASAAPVAAVMLDPRGLGQVLVFPYYTVNAGQDTLLTVVNTSNVGKAARVTFREGYNGRETLEFTLFLAAHDSWSGAVSAIDGTAASAARIASSDHSCVQSTTWPAMFSTTSFNDPTRDSGPQTADRTREGMVEVIALGDVIAGSPTDFAITPVQTGQPDAGTPPCDLPASIAGDLVAPTNGLTGNGAIVNVGEGTFYAYNPDALTGFTETPLVVPVAGEHGPNLSSARSSASQFAAGAIATVFDANGEPIRIDYERGIDAVSAVFMADALYNEFLIADGLGANTDWVIAFPTKQFYVDKQRYPSAKTSPFEQPFAGGDARVLVSTMDAFDSAGNPAWHEDFQNCHPAPLQVCYAPIAWLRYQINTLAFFSPIPESSGVFGSRLSTELLYDPFHYASSFPISDSGWLKLSLYSVPGAPSPHELVGGVTADGTPITLRGFPVAGFMAYNITNSQAAPGRLANYGGTFRHRTHWSCAGASEACP